jgi:superfamily I DNA/RNA helicase
LSTEKGVECFTACSEERKLYYEALFTGILTNISKLTLEERRAKEVELAKFVTVDFADYVPDSLYSAFGRRVRWFENTGIVNINLDDSSIQPIPSAGLFRKKVPVDYMIVDEVQDFSLLKIAELQKDTLKSISLFGDTVQQLYHDKGVSLDAIEAKTGYNRWQLNYNYRLPKTIAKLAQFVSKTELVDKCRKGDFPNFPLPVIKKCASQEEELDFIIERIQGAEKLEDVGILVPREAHVEQLYNYFNKKGVNTQVKYKKNIGSSPFGGMLYRQIDTLDFASTNPCILTYHSAKGTQFKNVFLPFCENSIEKNPFYVALTRSCYQVYITYKQSLTSLLANVPKEFFRSL